MSDRAKSFKIDVELDPMSSYERMIVHSYLEGVPEIKTESIGEGSSRRVVIKYIGAVSNPEKFI
jgi:predicted RNA-binding protein Jag